MSIPGFVGSGVPQRGYHVSPAKHERWYKRDINPHKNSRQLTCWHPRSLFLCSQNAPSGAEEESRMTIKNPVNPSVQKSFRHHVNQLIVPPGTEASSLHFGEMDCFSICGLESTNQALQMYAYNQKQNVAYQTKLFAQQSSSVLVIIQGFGFSGKDTLIRKLALGMNSSGCRTFNFVVPTDEELEFNFLWRCHAQCPSKGQLSFWNRSHYEDVTTRRIKAKLIGNVVAARFEMINAFEKILVSSGTKIIKVFLNIGLEEQFRRIERAARDPRKAYLLTPEHFEKHKLFYDYCAVWELVISRTSTDYAPWYIVPSGRPAVRDAVVSELILNAFRELNPQAPVDLSRSAMLAARARMEAECHYFRC